MNNAGVVVGEADLPGGSNQHAFFWNGHMNDLGSLGGGFQVRADGINNNGAIVGTSSLPGNMKQHGFIAYCHYRMVDLNTMMDASGVGWEIWEATAINDNGQVAAFAFNSSGQLHAVLLTFLGSLTC
jgi:probable HAF family extracellular repeat protein